MAPTFLLRGFEVNQFKIALIYIIILIRWGNKLKWIMRYILSICSILLLVQDLEIIQVKVTLIPRNSYGSVAAPVPKRQSKVSAFILASDWILEQTQTQLKSGNFPNPRCTRAGTFQSLLVNTFALTNQNLLCPPNWLWSLKRASTH